jgi:hypothetical protein
MSDTMQSTNNSTSVVTSNGSCGGISSPSARGSGGTTISSAATPGSYMYTSSSSLLRSSTGEKALPRAVPPPTLPKYTGGSSSYRLASLDRLAHRQRQFDQHQGSVITPQQVNGDAPTITSPSQQQQQQQNSAVSFNARFISLQEVCRIFLSSGKLIPTSVIVSRLLWKQYDASSPLSRFLEEIKWVASGLYIPACTNSNIESSYLMDTCACKWCAVNSREAVGHRTVPKGQVNIGPVRYYACPSWCFHVVSTERTKLNFARSLDNGTGLPKRVAI